MHLVEGSAQKNAKQYYKRKRTKECILAWKKWFASAEILHEWLCEERVDQEEANSTCAGAVIFGGSLKICVGEERRVEGRQSKREEESRKSEGKGQE